MSKANERHERLVKTLPAMDRDEQKVAAGSDLALAAFNESAQQCKTDDELSGFLRVMSILCIKTIHGMEGDQFKRDFLTAALADDEKIIPKKAH